MDIKSDKSVRYCPPTKIDKLPFGTVYHVINATDNAMHLYIQTNHDENSPHWERLGSLLEVAIVNKNHEFIQQCLLLL